MGDTFSELIIKIYEWYLEYLDINNISKEELKKKILEKEDDADIYIYDEIMNLASNDFEEFSKIVSLLSLEYYTMIYIDEEEPDEIAILMETSTKEDFIDELLDDECDYLFDMISEVLNWYQVGYSISSDFIFSESDYDYEYIEYICGSEKGKKVYKEFHPNLLKELSKLNKFKNELKIEDMIDKVKITSLFSYLYYLTTFRPVLNNNARLKQKFFEKLMEIEDKKIYQQILKYMVSYFYVTLDKNNLNDTEGKILEGIKNGKIKEDLDNISIPTLLCLLEKFINYDFIEYEKSLNNSSEEVKQMVKKLNIDNRK